MTSSGNPFGPIAHPLFAASAIVLWIAALFLFHGQPQWDLAVSGWFFDAAACAETAGDLSCSGFPVGGSPVFYHIREVLHPVPAILGIIALVMLVVEVSTGKRWRDAGVRVKAVLVTALIVGPGLIVNGVLKPHWGRPRPWMTEEFGGWLSFVEAGTNTDLCASNCSFVSGEAAVAGWLMCLAMLLAVRGWRWSALAIAVVSVVMAGLRVAFGAHYTSDAILGYTMTVVIFAVLAAISEQFLRRAR